MLEHLGFAVLRTAASRIPVLGDVLDVYDRVSDSRDKEELRTLLSRLNAASEIMARTTGKPHPSPQELAGAISSAIIIAARETSRAPFQVFLTNDRRAWALDALPDQLTTNAVCRWVEHLAGRLHKAYTNAAIIIDKTLPGPDFLLIDLGLHMACCRINRAHLSESTADNRMRSVQLAIDEVAYGLSFDVCWPCDYRPFQDRFQSISMRRTIVNDFGIMTFAHYEIATNGWAGSMNYFPIHTSMDFVPRDAPRSVISFAAYQLRTRHRRGLDPADLSGDFVFFERIRN